MIFLNACSVQKPAKSTVKKTKTTTKNLKTTTGNKPTISTPSKSEIDDFISVKLPEVKREFRGAWVATVANINWPSKNNLSVEQQKAEAIKMLDMLKDNNFNAVIFQARPSADALYNSSYEPWSYFLNGEIGKAPTPYYDPLEFWVKEAHDRGIELHVWINPYRVHHTSGGKVTSESMASKSPDNVVKLRNGMYWYDPASKKTQDLVSNIVKELVKKYDIDGIHFDDYFYPYASYYGGRDFPDDKTWNEYQRTGGLLSRADWRRDNVNRIVERIYKEIKAEKNYVKFGISPFGIWKPGYPEGITGSSQYDELYADAKLWLNKGWVDYFSPQLYWPINSTGQSFPALLKWWESENTQKRHLWPGLNTVEVKVADRPTEIVNQINVTRDIVPNSQGVIHWSVAGLTKNANMLPKLKQNTYQEKALIPKSSWIKTEKLGKPTLQYTTSGGMEVFNWASTPPKNAFQWVFYAQYGNDWETQILDKYSTHTSLPKTKNGKPLTIVAVQAIDRLGNEGEYAALKINKN